MARTPRSFVAALAVCLIGIQWSTPAFASDEHASATESSAAAIGVSPDLAAQLDERVSATPFVLGSATRDSLQSFNFSPQIYQGRPVPMRSNRNASIAAMMVGAIASITGAAILVYANRPECNFQPYDSGCGYGTKVVGGAVLSGGIASLLIGAFTWR